MEKKQANSGTLISAKRLMLLRLKLSAKRWLIWSRFKLNVNLKPLNNTVLSLLSNVALNFKLLILNVMEQQLKTVSRVRQVSTPSF